MYYTTLGKIQHIHCSSLLGDGVGGEGVLTCRDWFWTISSLGENSGQKRTDFCQCLVWESVVHFKGLIFQNFHFERVWWF